MQCADLWIAGVLSYVTPASPGYRDDEVLLHYAYFIYTFVDFWINGLHVRLLHFYIVPGYVVIYHLLTAILYYTLFASHYRRSMYSVIELRLNRIGICLLYFFAFVIALPLALHIVFFMLCLLRKYVIELPCWRRPFFFRRQYDGETLEEYSQTPARDEEVGGVGRGAGGGGRGGGSPVVGRFSLGFRSNKIMPIVEADEKEQGDVDEEGEIILASTIIESFPGTREIANRSARSSTSNPYRY